MIEKNSCLLLSMLSSITVYVTERKYCDFVVWTAKPEFVH